MIRVVILTLVGMTGCVSPTPKSDRDLLCRDIQWNLECARSVQATWLAHRPDLVWRQDQTLSIRLRDGRVITRRDRSEEETAEGFHNAVGQQNNLFTFSDYLDELGYVVVERHYYEGQEFEVVQLKSGTSWLVDDTPIFSPGREHIATVLNAQYDDCFSHLHIWAIGTRGLEEDFVYKPEQWPLLEAVWRSPAALTCTA